MADLPSNIAKHGSACNDGLRFQDSAPYVCEGECLDPVPDIWNDFEYTLTRRALRQIKAEAWAAGRDAMLEWDTDVYSDGSHRQPYPVNPHEETR